MTVTMKTIDARNMQPPEPFERVIEALTELPVGEELTLIVPHQPRPLFRFLESNGYVYRTQATDDGAWAIVIRELPT